LEGGKLLGAVDKIGSIKFCKEQRRLQFRTRGEMQGLYGEEVFRGGECQMETECRRYGGGNDLMLLKN